MAMKRKQGFTLIELLVVMAIIGVLFTLIMPAIASTRESARRTACMNNMRQLAAAALMYADDHGDVIPDVTELGSYIDDDDVYICPRDKDLESDGRTTSYTAFEDTPASLLPSDIGGLHSERVLFIESDRAGLATRENITGNDIVYARHDDRTVVVFVDGHVMAHDENEVSALILTAGPPIPDM